MLYLAAAVSDFFIPYAQLPEHKMQSRAEGGTMTITLWTVPKMLKFCKVWCPKAKVVSFKLETDAEVIDSKVALAFSESHVDAVVANLLHEIRTCVTVHIAANDSGNRKQVEILAGADESARTLEDRIVEVLLDALLPAQSTS
jgi:phosphopantothenate-cysteine ligase